jgi:phage shock protein E
MSFGRSFKSNSYLNLRLLSAVLFTALLLVVLTAATASESTQLPHSTIPRIDRNLLLGFLADDSTLTLIDARSPQEFTEQHLPGAINIPFDALDASAELLSEDKTKPIVVYCRTGERAGQLKEQLIARGYADIKILPREQIYWEEDFMVFNCSTAPANTTVDASPIRIERRSGINGD